MIDNREADPSPFVWNRESRRSKLPLLQLLVQFDKDRDVENENIEQIRRNFTDKNFGDVMVVGGGVSGIQASLDLAAAGFKVYLVEKAPSIGGHMAQLDKTFPTNDCSM